MDLEFDFSQSEEKPNFFNVDQKIKTDVEQIAAPKIAKEIAKKLRDSIKDYFISWVPSEKALKLLPELEDKNTFVKKFTDAVTVKMLPTGGVQVYIDPKKHGMSGKLDLAFEFGASYGVPAMAYWREVISTSIDIIDSMRDEILSGMKKAVEGNE